MLRIIAAAFVIASALLAPSVSQAGLYSFFANLDGPSEAPPNTSPGTGTTLVSLDTTIHLLTVDVSFIGLLGPTTASHIHCCTTVPGVSTAGIATVTPTFTGFPLGVTSGTYHGTFDTSTAAGWNPAFLGLLGINGDPLMAETTFLNGMLAGEAYLNIHTALPLGVPGGETRGFLQAPEPTSIALTMVGLFGIAAARRRLRR